MSLIDVWVLKIMKEVVKDFATHITIRELKRRLPEKVPQERKKEFAKRLSNFISVLRTGSRVSDKDIFLKLSNNPGII